MPRPRWDRASWTQASQEQGWVRTVRLLAQRLNSGDGPVGSSVSEGRLATCAHGSCDLGRAVGSTQSPTYANAPHSSDVK